MKKRVLIVLAIVAIAVGGFVVINRDDSESALSGPPVAPPKAAESPLFGVPLPEGAEADAANSRNDYEIYRVKTKVGRFGDIQAFYQELENKPIAEMEWCGTTSDDIGVNFLRIWKNPTTGQVLTVGLRENQTEGHRITISQVEAPNQECPPAPLDPDTSGLDGTTG